MKRILALIMIFVLLINAYCYATYDYGINVWSDAVSNTKDINLEKISINSKSAVLMEAKTGEVLFSYNCDEKLRPASVTKIMTILLIFENLQDGNISLDDIVPCSENAMSMGGSQIWLDPKDNLTVYEMLKAICVVSANDCCVAMAEYISGSTEQFVNLMNAKAKELGMHNTNFVNCHGLDEDNHVTSAYDIALMSRELISNYPEVSNYSTIWMDSLRGGKSQLVNTNKLIRSYKGITGLKTGSTSLALYNLSATATRDNLSLIAVVMGNPTSQDRFADATKILNFGFANYEYKTLCGKGEGVCYATVKKGKEEKINAVYEQDIKVLLMKNQGEKITKVENVYEIVNAPVSKGDKIGEVKYYLDGNTIAQTNLVAENEVKRIGFWECFLKCVFSL